MQEIATENGTFIIGGRGHGKTARCIQWAETTNGYIICKDHERAYDIMRQAKEMGFPDIRFPITLKEFVGQRFCGKGCSCFAFDDLDEMLRMLARNVPIDLVTWTERGPDGKD